MAKIMEKIGAVLSGWATLPKLIEKGDRDSIHRLLAGNTIDTRLVDVLLLIPSEAAKLEAIIAENSDLGNADEIEFELSSLSRAAPKTADEASAIAKATTDCLKRKNKNWHGGFARRRAEAALYCLREGFAECFDGTAGKTPGLLLGTNIYNKVLELGLDPSLLNKGPWREAFKLQAIQPKRRVRLVAH